MARLDHVTDTLYISDALSVVSSEGKTQMRRLNIERVLTASGIEISGKNRLPAVEYFHIFMMDVLSQDILGSGILHEALLYIEQAVRDKANVLVHCEAGISRSVTLAAAYVMRKFEWSAEKALLFIQRSRPIASPNASFRQQLKIFEQLRYQADPRTLALSAIYRGYCADHGEVPIPVRAGSDGRRSTPQLPRLAAIATHSSSSSLQPVPPPEAPTLSSSPNSAQRRSTPTYTEQPAPLTVPPVSAQLQKIPGDIQADSGVQSASSSSMSTRQEEMDTGRRHSLVDTAPWARYHYSCWRCRSELFNDTHLMPHTLGGVGGMGQACGKVCAIKHLLTPMDWMSLKEYQGKIHCPKCKEKLGHYNWGGTTCRGEDSIGCGAFGGVVRNGRAPFEQFENRLPHSVSPWIHIIRHKVDGATVRTPAGMEGKVVPKLVLSSVDIDIAKSVDHLEH